jgi:hypothetical protein
VVGAGRGLGAGSCGAVEVAVGQVVREKVGGN